MSSRCLRTSSVVRAVVGRGRRLHSGHVNHSIGCERHRVQRDTIRPVRRTPCQVKTVRVGTIPDSRDGSIAVALSANGRDDCVSQRARGDCNALESGRRRRQARKRPPASPSPRGFLRGSPRASPGSHHRRRPWRSTCPGRTAEGHPHGRAYRETRGLAALALT
jgi:hypothetical protein